MATHAGAIGHRPLEGLRAGLLAGAICGVLFFVLSLLRVGSDLFVTAPDGRFAMALILRSLGTYGLLFALGGGLLGAALSLTFLRHARSKQVACWCASLLGGGIALLFLTVQRQLDDYGGLPMAAPERRSGALLDLAVATVLLFALAAILLRLVRGCQRAPHRRSRLPTLLLATLLVALGAGELLFRGDQAPASQQAARKVVVVGLDGLTFRVLSPLLREGRLPTISRLMEEGAWGTLMTYGTASSPRIWTSMATGKKTRDHGIDDFVQVGRGYAAVPYKSSDRRVKAIWNILSERERRVAVVDWHITFPPEEVRGVMVTRLQLKADGRTYPPELDDDVATWIESLEAPPTSTGRAGLDRGTRLPFVITERLREAADAPFDLTALYTTAPDSASHGFWKHYEPEAFDSALWQIDPADTAARRHIIPNVYEAVDRELGSLLASLDDQTLLLIVSDHGLRAARKPRSRLRVDKLLAELGFAAFDGRRIDHASSRAFQLTETLWKPILRVNLNVAEREPTGIVPPRRAESLRRRLVELLRAVRFENGEPLFSEVRSEPIGSRRHTQADLELVPRADLWDPAQLDRVLQIGDEQVPLSRFADVDTTISGAHDRQGVLFLRGPGVRPQYVGQRVFASPIQELIWNLADKVDAVDLLLPPLQTLGFLDKATTLDLTPMVLHVLGEPVARDMAGRPRPGFWSAIPPVQRVDTYEDGTRAEPADQSDAADAEELERLRALGYIN